MGAYRPLVACFLILLTLTSRHPPAGRAAPQGDDSYVIVSMAPNGPGTYDVKLKNTRTGYIHSLTLIAEIALRFVIGALVKERREGGRVVLVPVGGPRPGRSPGQPPGPSLPVTRWAFPQLMPIRSRTHAPRGTRRGRAIMPL